MQTMEIYTYEEGGYYFITDQYDLIKVQFQTGEERQKWIDGFEAETGKRPVVITGKPDIMANLRRF